eukprot:Selendium_serpulae@DN5076_c0_g1_i1.p1
MSMAIDASVISLEGERRKFKRQDPSLKQLQELNESTTLDMAREALHQESTSSRSYNTRQGKRPRQMKFDGDVEVAVPKIRKAKQTKRPQPTDSDSTRDESREAKSDKTQRLPRRESEKQLCNKQKNRAKKGGTQENFEADVGPQHYRCWPVVKEVSAFLHSEIPTLGDLQAMGVFHVV